MRVIEVNKFDQEIKIDSPLVIAHGFFDGVHLGHQKLIQEAKQKSVELDSLLAVVTFNTKPVVADECNLDNFIDYVLISPMDYKLRLFESLGVDLVFIVNFYEFKEIDGNSYINDFLLKIRMKHLVLGIDNKFGAKGEVNASNIALYAKDKFSYTLVGQKNLDDEKISSSSIRRHLIKGEVELANQQLGYFYTIEGKVFTGEKVGRTLGFPTANLRVNHQVIVPKPGVYATFVKYLGNYYKAMTNIGYNPTIENFNTHLTIESHLINQQIDLYDQQIDIYFIARIRDEQKFSSIDELKTQLQKDQEISLEILTNSSEALLASNI